MPRHVRPAPGHIASQRARPYVVRMFAELTPGRIKRAVRRQRDEATTRIRSILDGHSLSIVYQPIFDIRFGQVTGYEALSRFSNMPSRSPEMWFAEASSVDLGPALECKAIQAAQAGFDGASESYYLGLNVCPETLLCGELDLILGDTFPLERVLLEITEHAIINEYKPINRALASFRARGAKVAVDDAGSGYASFRHVLGLEPDVIKLDVSLIRDIDTHKARRALAAALIAFGEETGSEIVAEGVETEPELSTLRDLGVTKAQGFFLGRPGPLA